MPANSFAALVAQLEHTKRVKQFARKLIGRDARSIVTQNVGVVSSVDATIGGSGVLIVHGIELATPQGKERGLRIEQIEFLSGEAPMLQIEQPESQNAR